MQQVILKAGLLLGALLSSFGISTSLAAQVRRANATEVGFDRKDLFFATGWSTPALSPLPLALEADASHDLPLPTVHAASPSRVVIIVGFVGGFVRHDDGRHSEVQLAAELRSRFPNSLHAQVFENRHRGEAHHDILRWLDTDGDGKLSEDEKNAAYIILYGHSWGAAATLALARQLQTEASPVRLVVGVDSVRKLGKSNQVVPANVARAINFYPIGGILHGMSQISAADPAQTQIVGNFRYEHRKVPRECNAYPRLFNQLSPGHIAIECDPEVWNQLKEEILSEMSH